MLGSFLDIKDPDLSELIRAVVNPDQYDYGALVLVSSAFQNSLAAFVGSRQISHHFQLWWKYIEMVHESSERRLISVTSGICYHTVTGPITPTTLDGDVCTLKK